MKLLATGDWQLGAGPEYGTPERPRLHDQEEVLAGLAAYVGDGRTEHLLHAGDVFQHRRPSPAEYLAAQGALDYYGEVHICPGNHDVQAAGVAPSPRVIGGGNLNVYEWPAVRFLGGSPAVFLAVLPWTHPSTWRAEYGHAGTAEGMVQALTDVAAGLRARIEEERAVLPGGPAAEVRCILLHHYGMQGFALPNGLAVGGTLGLTEPVLDPHELAAQGWDYVIAGHIQRPQHERIGGCHVIVTGSPYVCDFGEAHYEHGAWLIDTESGPRFLPLPDRPFVTLEGPSAEYVAHALAGYEALEGAVVRVRITCTEEEARRQDIAALRRCLYEGGVHKVYAVTLDVQREVRRRAEVHEDTAPLEALDLYLGQAPDVTPGRAAAMRERHARYLEEAAR